MVVTGEEVLAVASREIGYCREKSGKSKFGEWYAERVHDKSFAYAPYCMAFVQWVYYQLGYELPLLTASCGTLLRWYQANQPDCVTKEPIQGCLCIFDFPKTKYDTDHIGLFVSKTDTKLTTIDGNTSNGNESNGGYVQQRTRRFIDLVNLWYIIPRGLVLVDWDKAISEMTDEQAYKIYCKAENHMSKLPLPVSWNAAGELREAKTLGIADGDRPQVPARRYEAAIMVKRALSHE